MTIDTVVLLVFVGAALWTVMTRSLLRSAIGLALTSIVLTILMFRLAPPLAAVFELSVCAGLISVLFVSTISLTRPLTHEEVIQEMHERLGRFWVLPVIVIVVLATLSLIHFKPVISLPAPETLKDIRTVLWHGREVDVLGQILVLLVGVFGVVILFKERVKK